MLSALAIGGLVLGIHEGPEKGWSAPLTVVALIVGVVSLRARSCVWERRADGPLLDISAFRDRGLASGTVTLLIVFAVMFGVFLVLFPYFQAVLGWSALLSAAAMLPMTVVMMPMSTIAPKIATRIGGRNTMATGVTIFAVGLVTMALRASVEGGYMSVLPGLVLIGLGMGLTMTPATAGDHRDAAAGEAGRRLGAQRHVPRARRRRRHRPARLGARRRLQVGHRADARRRARPSWPSRPAKASAPRSRWPPGPATRRRRSSTPPSTRSSTAGCSSMWLGVGMAAVALVYLLVRGPVRVTADEPGDEPAVALSTR